MQKNVRVRVHVLRQPPPFQKSKNIQKTRFSHRCFLRIFVVLLKEVCKMGTKRGKMCAWKKQLSEK